MQATTELNVADLKADIRGHVCVPGEECYDTHRAPWNLTINHQPEVIVTPIDEQDVRAAVRFAAESDLPITVQSTGHGQFREAVGGMLINTSRLKGIEIDPVAKTARLGAGCVWGEVTAAAATHGLAPLSGSSPTVGVIGYLLGGGYSLLLRKHGLGIDHVKSFQVVLSDGSLVTASPSENADLFWALCGGGGSFGVITEVEVALFDHAMVYGGSLMFPAERAHEVYSAFSKWTAGLTEEVSSALIMITFPPVPFVPEFLQGRSMVVLAACMSNSPEAESWVKPMRDLGPEFDMLGPLPYTESARVYNDPVDPLPACGRGVLLNELTQETVDVMLKAIGEPARSPNLMIQLRHLGGAVSRGDINRGVSGNTRGAQYLLYLLGVPMGPNTPPMMRDHAEGVFTALQPWVLSRGPLNFVGERDISGEELGNLFGDQAGRLKEVKAKYDPQNLFRSAGIGIDG